MPVTVAPKCSAACNDSDPQPQPTSRRRHPRLEAELAADQRELVELGLLDRDVRRGVVAAGVRHLRLEDQAVELVGEVVVEADRPAVTQLAVQPALDLWPARRAPSAGCRGPRGPRVRGAPGDRGGRGAAGAQPALGDDRPDVGQRLVQVPTVGLRDVDLAGDVGLGGPELARSPHEAAHGVGGVDDHEGTVDRAGLRPVPGAQPDRQLAADERLEDPGERAATPPPVVEPVELVVGVIGVVATGVPGPPSRSRRKVSWLTSM